VFGVLAEQLAVRLHREGWFSYKYPAAAKIAQKSSSGKVEVAGVMPGMGLYAFIMKRLGRVVDKFAIALIRRRASHFLEEQSEGI
jgi:hypothetical protein